MCMCVYRMSVKRNSFKLYLWAIMQKTCDKKRKNSGKCFYSEEKERKGEREQKKIDEEFKKKNKNEDNLFSLSLVELFK